MSEVWVVTKAEIEVRDNSKTSAKKVTLAMVWDEGELERYREVTGEIDK